MRGGLLKHPLFAELRTTGKLCTPEKKRNKPNGTWGKRKTALRSNKPPRLRYRCVTGLQGGGGERGEWALPGPREATTQRAHNTTAT